MLIEIALAILVGIIFGIITGLIPGIHINLIGVFLVSMSSTILLGVEPFTAAVFIVSMSMTHTFIDFIPTTFLGCPDTSTELSVLPGHDLLKKGQGYQAIMMTAYGSLAAIFILIIIAYPSLKLFEIIHEATKGILPWLIIGISSILIFLENKKLTALFVFLLTGALGTFVMNLEPLEEPLLPLLTGLFGSSMMIESLKHNPEIPKQRIQKPKLRSLKPIAGSVIASPLCSFLPGLGSGQAAIIGQTVTSPKKKPPSQNFLTLVGATNTLVMGFSFITLYLLSKTRTGSAHAISEIVGGITSNMLIVILGVVFISGIFAFFLTDFLAQNAAKIIHKISYNKITLVTVAILCFITVLVSGWIGLGILALSTVTGLYCISLGVRKTNMMGCLLIPTTLFYLFGLGG